MMKRGLSKKVIVRTCVLAFLLAFAAMEFEGVFRAMSGVVGSNLNPLQIGLLHWYEANVTTQFPVGTGPGALALANQFFCCSTGTVSKL